MAVMIKVYKTWIIFISHASGFYWAMEILVIVLKNRSNKIRINEIRTRPELPVLKFCWSSVLQLVERSVAG